MSVEDAVEMVKATPPERRSQFAKEIWRLRRERWGARGHSGRGYGDKVPF